MKATRWHGDGDIRVDDIAEPVILEDTDAVVRVTLAGICGTELHLDHAGSALGLPVGMRIGQEFVGVVESVGRAVRGVKPGDRVVSPCAFCDNTCFFCEHDLHCSCQQGGIFGFAPMWKPEHGPEIQGRQSEFVRVPFALVPFVGGIITTYAEGAIGWLGHLALIAAPVACAVIGRRWY